MATICKFDAAKKWLARLFRRPPTDAELEALTQGAPPLRRSASAQLDRMSDDDLVDVLWPDLVALRRQKKRAGRSEGATR
jgi:TorA maturation chaperone TorD